MCRKPNGIEVTAYIERINWIEENPRFPEEPKYIGELKIPDGGAHIFLSDEEIYKEEQGIQIDGDLIHPFEYTVIEISELHRHG